MRRPLVFFLIILLFDLKSQTKEGWTYKEYFQEGTFHLQDENYPTARENFSLAYRLDSSSANINYMMGMCMLRSTTHKRFAEKYFAKAVTKISRAYKTDQYRETSAPVLAYLYYGQALHYNHKFKEALEQYDLFEKNINAVDLDYKKMVARDIATTRFAIELVSAPINVVIRNMGDSINSKYAEYSPVFSADERTLIFTTRRPKNEKAAKSADAFLDEDIVISHRNDQGQWSKPKPISRNINTIGMEASLNLSPDGKTLLIYKDDGGKMGGNIYYSTYENNRWSELKDFGSDVNTIYMETHACLSSDGNTLFFVSDRPGGLGGKDIYRCMKLPNGKWSKSYNLGPEINTEYDEDGGFIHNDGVTFFFASKGHNTMGGYDVMHATLTDDNKFTNVTNIGYPINSTDDDIFYVTSPSGRRGYFSSYKESGFGDKDLYVITMPDIQEKALVLFKGQIKPSEDEELPEGIFVIATERQSGDIFGVYHPKIENGTFSTILPPGREFDFSYQTKEGKEFYRELVIVKNEMNYQEIKQEVLLEPVKVNGMVKTLQKKVFLNVEVAENNKRRIGSRNARLLISEKEGNTTVIEIPKNGKIDSIALKPGKKYQIYAEAAGKRSDISEVSTLNMKRGELTRTSLNLKNVSAPQDEKSLLLDVFVKTSGRRQISSPATITVYDEKGNKQEGITDKNGTFRGFALEINGNYEAIVNGEGLVSQKINISTQGLKPGKTIEKTILVNKLMSTNLQTEVKNIEGAAATYQFFFKYNKDQNEEDEGWNEFINQVVLLSKTKQVTVDIKASASRVPTRAYRNNDQLAAKRATALQTRIKEAVQLRDGSLNRVKFNKEHTVGGPQYDGDHDIRSAKYEEHQYVKAVAR